MPNPVAEFAEVSKTFRAPRPGGSPVHALRQVGLRIEPGEVFGLVGPNRAGKTTLLKILLGLCHPSSGRVYRLGHPASDRQTLARVGYMHENQAFPRYLTAAALLDYFGRLSRIPPSTLRARVPALLDRLALADRAREPIARYSKGMVQRLALAHALLAEPDLLVLDEPTEGLDPGARMLLYEVVARQRREGKSVLLVSHSLDEVARVCNRVAVLVEGRIAHLEALPSLLRDPHTRRGRPIEEALGPFFQ
jgi:ABC-2 type transport system ATP-binding protein